MSNEPKSKQFNIILGDSFDIIKQIETNKDFKEMMKKDGWTLYRTTNNLYWVIGEDIVNIVHQFMIYRNPIVYIYFNYHVKTALETVQKLFTMAKRDLQSHKNKKYIIIGVNYKDFKFQKIIKKNILEFCIEQESKIELDTLSYMDFEDLLHEIIF